MDTNGLKRFVGTTQLKSTQLLLGKWETKFKSSLAYFPPFPTAALRVYPEKFGRKLLDVYKAADFEECRRDLRKVFAVDPKLTDRENFKQYPTGDIWSDANLLDVVKYVYNYEGLRIPDSWAETMQSFMEEVSTHVSQLCIFCGHSRTDMA